MKRNIITAIIVLALGCSNSIANNTEIDIEEQNTSDTVSVQSTVGRAKKRTIDNRPLMGPGYIYTSLGAGLSSIRYNNKFGDRKPGAGGRIDVGYNGFVSDYWGWTAGIGLSLYNSKTVINDYQEYSGTVHDYYGEQYGIVYRTNYEDWTEKQKVMSVSVPLGVSYRHPLTSAMTINANAGVELMFPFSSKYKVKQGVRKMTGEVGSLGLTFDPDMTEHGFYTEETEPNGDNDIKSFQFGIFTDVSLVQHLKSVELFYGLFASMGFGDLSKGNDELSIPQGEYNGVLNSNVSDKIALASIGVKVGVKIPMPKQIDSDGDGILDNFDECPGTPADAIGYVDDKGCPKDSDEDGVPDYMDECPGTILAARSFVNDKGCPKDSDGDGVLDYLDKCPDTPKEALGHTDYDGCPKDSDGDGVLDYLDKCPDTPKEAFSSLTENGCPKDSDGDGVYDYLDKCPTTPGSVENKGCPEVEMKDKEVLQKALHGVQFETNKFVLKKTSYSILDQVAKLMAENPSYKLYIKGHTDNVGDPDKNLQLSRDRANAVKEYLVKKGIDSARMMSEGFGDTKPVVSNDTEEGRAENRRVEFIVEYEE